jgi:hypothetical protein
MPAGSFDFSPEGSDVVLSEPATPILVCRYDSTQDSGSRYTYLPNVWCDQIQDKEGEPQTAQFRYIQFDFIADGSPGDNEDQDENADYPSQFEETWPIASAPNNYKVKAGDELVVLAVDSEGNYRVRWHGFAKVPQVDLDPSSQVVSFTGSSVAERLWDTVIAGRTQRNGDTPTTPSDSNDPSTLPFQTDLETRFNPDDHGNCIPDDSDETFTDEDGNEFDYPVFFDPALFQNPGGPPDTIYQPVATFWTLGKMVRYLLAVYNKQQQWLTNPDFSVLDVLLSNRAPNGGNGFYDPSDPSTYTQQPIIVRDYDATNKPWVDVINEQLHCAGFRMRFVCEGNPSSSGGTKIVEEPFDYIEIYRFDQAGPTDPKQCFLPVTRSPLDPDLCNVSSFTAVNDFHSLANQFSIETRPNRYEVSVILAPGFQPSSGDAAAAAQRQFLHSNLDSATMGVRQKYRYFVADELGEGHWLQNTSTMDTTPFDFSPVFPPETFDFETTDGFANDEDQGPGIDDADQPEPGGTSFNSTPTYAIRYRRGLRDLLSKDPAGKILHAQLALSRDYSSASNGYAKSQPSVWDGTGTWQVIDGGWELLHDRLGINVTVEDVNSWGVGKAPPPGSGSLQEPSGTLQAIKAIASPNPLTTGFRQAWFTLRLTCVIESDQCIEAVAQKRETSPYPFTIERRVDAKDHFVKNVIDGSSVFFASQGGIDGTPLIAKDDTLAAQTHVEQMRAAHEFPPLAASIHIPWFSRVYNVSDRVNIMAGREVSFQVNAGGEQGEASSYPFVSAITWDFRGNSQKTILMLSDRRMEPRKA